MKIKDIINHINKLIEQLAPKEYKQKWKVGVADGSVAFAANGVQLSTEANRQNFYPESVYYAVNDELITYWFQTNGNQMNYSLY